MHYYSLDILVLLVTGHDTVTNVLPLIFLSPLLVLSALVIFAHTYASSAKFARHISGLYDRYETLNFYQPGYKSYSDRRHIALCQIAAEELVKKLEKRFSGDVVQSGQENSTLNYSTSLPLVPKSTSRLVAWLMLFGSIAVYLSSATLRDSIAVLIQAALYSLTVVFSRSFLIYIVISALAGFLGVCRGLNHGLIECIVFICQIISSYVPSYLDARILAAFVCVAHVGINLAIPTLQYVANRLAVHWTTVVIWVSAVMVCAWAYPIRGRLYRCSKRAIASIGQSAWAWEELYDKDHDFLAEPEPKLVQAAAWKPHVLRSERWPPGPESARPNQLEMAAKEVDRSQVSYGQDTRHPITGISGKLSSASRPSLRIPQVPVSLEEPRSTTHSGPEARRSALAAIATPANGTQTASLPTSTSPSTSIGSLPELAPNQPTPNTSPESGTPAGQHFQPAIIYSPNVSSRFSSLCMHGFATRGRAKISPTYAPKQVVEARTAVGDEKAMAVMHRSEWKQRAKARKERKTAMEMAMEVEESPVEEREHSPMEIETGRTETGPPAQPVPAMETRDAGMVEPQGASGAQPALAPISSSVESPSSTLSQPMDVPEVVAAGEPVGAREMKSLPRSRRHMAARSVGTDAPATTGQVASTSNELPASSFPLPSNSGSVSSTSQMETTPAPPASTSAAAMVVASTAGVIQAPSLAEAPSVLPAPMDTPSAYPGPTSISRLDTQTPTAPPAVSPPTIMTPQDLTAATDSKTTRPGIPKVRMVPVYTWLMDDGTKRVMKKGEAIPARAKYTVKGENGTKLMSVGAKPLRV